MANDFSLGPASLKNRWLYNTGALGTDSEGNDDLSSYGGAASVDTDPAPNQASDWTLDIQGSDDFVYIADNDMSTSHPWKEGSSGDWTWCSWFKFDSVTGQISIISKYSTDASYLRSFHLLKIPDDDGSNPNEFGATWGTSGGGSYNAYILIPGYALQTARWYHGQVKYDESETNLYSRIWDETANDWLTGSSSFVETSVANAMNRSNAYLSIGAAVYTPSSYLYDMDGRHKETLVFNELISDADLEDIKDGVYGAGAIEVSISDSMSISESISVNIPPAGINIIESMTISESIGINLPLAASISDSITILENIGDNLPLSTTIAESITIAELITLIKDLADISLEESMIIIEAITVEIEAIGAISTSLSDSMTIAEAIGLNIPVNISIIDSQAISETIAINLPISISPTETMTLTELIQVKLNLSTSIVESMSISELISIGMDLGFPIIDVMQIQEEIAGLLDILCTISETMTISEIITASLSSIGLARNRGLLLRGVGT